MLPCSGHNLPWEKTAVPSGQRVMILSSQHCYPEPQCCPLARGSSPCAVPLAKLWPDGAYTGHGPLPA